MMPDLLITDVRLGVYNGLQLLMRGRMVNPRLQAIVITGYADQIVRREAVYLHAEHLEVIENQMVECRRSVGSMAPA